MRSVRLWILAIMLIGTVTAIACGGDPPPVAADPAETASESDPEPQPEPELEPDGGSWVTDTSTNPLDDSRTVVAILEATDGVGGLRREPINLVVRCRSNETDAYINWNDYLGDDDSDSIRTDEKRVTYRFPPADAQTEMWGVSTDDEATFVASPIPLLRALVESDQFVVQTTPFNESPSTAIFDLTGAEAAIAPIAEECGWTLRVTP